MSEKQELVLYARRYYAISEVSEVTGFPMSTLRYLSNHFRKFFTPRRSSGEHRRFQAWKRRCSPEERLGVKNLRK